MGAVQAGAALYAAITTVHSAVKPAVPQASSRPSHAAIIQTFEGLMITWVDAATPGSSSQVEVPETSKLLFSDCEPSPHASLCNEDCADEIEGVGAFAATQTSDGDLWLAYTEVTRTFLFDYGAPDVRRHARDRPARAVPGAGVAKRRGTGPRGTRLRKPDAADRARHVSLLSPVIAAA
jgi:hypothetical protein